MWAWCDVILAQSLPRIGVRDTRPKSPRRPPARVTLSFVKNVTVLAAHGITSPTWHHLTLTKRNSSRR